MTKPRAMGKDDTQMKVGIIIQARMGSTRLPGKVLRLLEGEPIVLRLIRELRTVQLASTIIVATTQDPGDDKLADLLRDEGIPYFRGAVDDVLCRFYEVSKQHQLDLVVRVNADCPFLDGALVDAAIERKLDSTRPADYVSTILEETFPVGMHVEVFDFKALQRSHLEAVKADEREHVTPYIYRNKDLFVLENMVSDQDLSRYRLTIDYEQDMAFAQRLSSHLRDAKLPDGKVNDLPTILNILEANPDIVELNANISKKQNLK